MSLVKFFDDLGYTRGLSSLWEEFEHTKMSFPPIDLYHVQGGLELKADLPGFTKDLLNLNINGNILTLSGERNLQTQDRTAFYSERKWNKFIRRIKLPYLIDPNLVYAEMVDGILTVQLPTQQVDQSARIMIN
jgi:HSP20 family protein